MSAFGRNNVWPFKFGGGTSTRESIHIALLDAYSPGWDASEGTENWAECLAYAQAVSMIWAMNERLANQAIPERMLENLTVFEEACKLRPTPDDLDIERRKRVAAKLRGLADNTLGDIFDACAKALGSNFDGINLTAPADVVAYWPGINPGFPGFEWSSNRLHLGIRMNNIGLSNKDYIVKVATVSDLLDGMLPVYMTFSVGVDGGIDSDPLESDWIVNIGILRQTFL